MTISKISLSNRLSSRSYNICIDNELFDINSIVNFFLINKNFYKLKNCGRRSNNELVDFCNEYINDCNLDDLSCQKNNNSLSNIILKLSEGQIKLLNDCIKKMFDELSVRSQNALSSYLTNKIDLFEIYNKILNLNDFKFNSIQKVGLKSEIELNSFVLRLINLINELSTKNEISLKILKKKLFFEKLFPTLTTPENLLEENSIIELIDYLLYQDAFFDKNENFIFNNTFNIYKNSNVISKQEISSILDISEERVRQLKIYCLQNLPIRMEFIKLFDVNLLLQKFEITDIGDIIIIDDLKLTDLNNELNTKFSNDFLFFIIYILCSEEFEILREDDFILNKLHKNKKKSHNWKNYYLIRKKNIDTFDFLLMLNDINSILNKKNNRKYELDLYSYLINFSKVDCVKDDSTALQIASKIIVKEFGVNISNNNTLIIERNTEKLISEYAVEILEKLGRPSKLKDIYNIYSTINSNFSNNINSFQVSINRSDEIINIGKNGTYSLKKWKKEKNNIKYFSIRDIVYEMLLSSNEPIHLFEIYKFIIKHKPLTSIRSIKTNIKIGKKFIVFPNNYIGLSSKKYNSNKINFNKINGTYFSISNLQKFNHQTIDEIIDFFYSKFSYDKKQVEYILNCKINNNEIIKLNNKLIINKNFNESVDLVNEVKIENLEELIKIIKSGNRISAYFYFNINNKFKNKKRSDEIFNLIWDKYQV